MNEEGSEISEAESSLEAHTQDKTKKKKRKTSTFSQFRQSFITIQILFFKKRRLESKKQERNKGRIMQPTYIFHA